MPKTEIIKYLKSSDLPYILVLFICCIIAWWPVSFFVYSLKNDALNYFLPVRFQVSEAISNGYWPFWSPYFNLGYPLHGDMQSGVWNPFVQILSLFGPYTLKTLHYETLLYLFLSGIGMFYLLKYFSIDKRLCLLVGVSYMLCGYNSDSAQFLNWISSASFLPFVILFSFKAVDETSLNSLIYCGFFLYLFFVTSYPADFIILIYLLVIFFVWHFFQTRGFKKKMLLALFRKLSIVVLIFTLLSLPAIVSYLQFLPLTERGSGTSYNLAMSNPLHPSLLFSYITPLAVWKASFASITDPLERNCYFGLLAVTFLITGFFIQRVSPWIKFCKWGFIISIIFSLGEIGILRPLTYHVLPLMDSFRHPANAKIFTMFFGCNIAAFAMQRTYFSPQKNIVSISFNILALILIILLIWACFGNIGIFNQGITLTNLNTNTLKQILDSSTFSDLLLINIFIQLPFLWSIHRFSKNKIDLKTLISLGLINCIIHTMLFMPFTVVKKERADYIQDLLTKKIVKETAKPDLNSSIEKNSEEGYILFKEIGALNMYNKKIGRIDYRITPSNLNSQNMFWNKNSKLRNSFIKYPLLYKATQPLLIKDSAKVKFGSDKFILVNDTIALSSSFFQSGNYSAVVERFTPNRWDISISSSVPGVYCLFQNFYPNWKLYVDGKEKRVLQCNLTFMGFTLDEGDHSITFIYDSNWIQFCFFINLSLLTVTFLLATKEIGMLMGKKIGNSKL